MQGYQEKKTFRAFFASRAVLSVLFLFIIGTGIISFRALIAGWEVEEQRRMAEEELQKLKAEREMLSSEMKALQSGRGIEREAREKLNLRKLGEEVVVILEDESTKADVSEEMSSSLWERLRTWLFGD